MAVGAHYMEAAAAIGHAACVCVDGLGRIEERAIDTHLPALGGLRFPFPQPAMPAKDFRQAVGSEAKAGRRMPSALGGETVFSRHRGNSGREPSAVESPGHAALVRCCL